MASAWGVEGVSGIARLGGGCTTTRGLLQASLRQQLGRNLAQHPLVERRVVERGHLLKLGHGIADDLPPFVIGAGQFVGRGQAWIEQRGDQPVLLTRAGQGWVGDGVAPLAIAFTVVRESMPQDPPRRLFEPYWL
jgi:hypothetical protein